MINVTKLKLNKLCNITTFFANVLYYFSFTPLKTRKSMVYSYILYVFL